MSSMQMVMQIWSIPIFRCSIKAFNALKNTCFADIFKPYINTLETSIKV